MRTKHLCKDAAHGPHVGGGPVAAGAQQQLGRTVPARGHSVRVRGSPACPVMWARQAQVAHLEDALFCQQQIGWLQVSV